MYPHRIRLRGPWLCEPLYWCRPGPGGGWVQTTDNLPEPYRLTMPALWQDSPAEPFRGGAVFSRSFGYPGRIDAGERVWLTVDGVVGQARAALNGTELGPLAAQGEFNVTQTLQSRNQLALTIDSRAGPGGIMGDVALEIRARAFLRDIHFEKSAETLEVRALVVGETDRPLEVYLIHGRRCAAYTTVIPTAAGQPIRLTGDQAALAAEPDAPVRLELIDAATVWYVAHGPGSENQSISGPESSKD